MKHERTHKKIKQAEKMRMQELAESPPDKEAYKRFKSPAYQVGRLIREQAEQMTVKDLVDEIFEMVNTGRLKMSDPVPEGLLMRETKIDSQTVAEYVEYINNKR